MKTRYTKAEREFRKHYRELLKTTVAKLTAYGDAALASGAVSLEPGGRGPYRTPKNVMAAACLDTADQWGPVCPGTLNAKADLKAIKNIRTCTPYP